VKKVSAKVSTAKLVDSSALPLSLAVMLVAFSGIAGSFLSGSLTLLRRYLPRRSKLA
jgi:hypothetical protein